MQAVKRWLAKRHTIDRRMCAILIVIFSFFITCAMLSLTPVEGYITRSMVAWSYFLMPLLNWLPVMLLMFLLYSITANVILSISSVSFVMLAMAITNRLKIQMRGDPLFHWDFSLISEVVGIAKGFGNGIIACVLGIAVLYILLTAFLMRRFRSEPLGWKRRLVYTSICVLAAGIGNPLLYRNAKVDSALPVWGSFYNQADVSNSKGNLYAFLYTFNTTRSTKPEGYDAGATRAFAEAYEQANKTDVDAQVRPNIIMIMGEAFSDLSESPALSFEGYTDPLAHYKALGQEGIAGHIVVPSRGGGTADTEHDVLTARAARFLRGMPYAYRTIAGPTQALPSLLETIGYDSFALHPGYPWFYNRQNVYKDLGFAESVFEDSFPREAYEGVYISETATFDQLLAMIEERATRPDPTPFFGFCLTIQNHAAYVDRFLPAGTVTFATDLALTDEETNILSNYFAGIADADAQLARLTNYLDSLDEPYILVYYGDHLPSLEENLYELLIPGADAEEGSLLAETRLYAVPFIIWENAAAKEITGIAETAKGLIMPENMTISSSFLGAYLLELLGLDCLSPFMMYANEVRASVPVMMESFSYDIHGKPIQDADDDAQALLRDYRRWMYALTAE